MTFQDQNLATKFLSKEELKSRCPLAFAKTPTNPKVSDKYVLANSETIIDDMEKLGWYPTDARQRRARGKESVYSYHMIAFQNPNVSVMRNNDDGSQTVECYPRIIMTNSHDGYNAFKFVCGLFRLVCSNGLVIATDKSIDMSIRHINYTFESLRELVYRSVEELPKQIEVMNDMKNTILSEAQQKQFVTDMVKIRKDIKEEEQVELSDLTINDILNPVREEDYGNDLWSIFNVVQEKMTKGGFELENLNKEKQWRSTTGKLRRKVRPVKSFVKDLDMNKKMFERALVYMDVKEENVAAV